MASIVPNENQGSSLHESDTSQKVHVNHTDMDGRTISDDNDRNSNVSPSKASDPARKKTFKIISVKKGGTDTGSGDIVNDNDADSVDGLELDESQTEDYSSEFYDSSKATDIDIDAQDTPLTPDEVGSTTTIVMKQRPDQNSQSRFKVVRIETKDPFRRGKWVCHDFFDSAPAAVVTLNGSKAIEDSIIQSALPVALNSSSSVHYVHDVNESSSNLFVAPVVPINPSAVHGQPILTDMFFPIQPALASQAQGLIDGSQNVVTQYPQPIHMSVAGVPSSSSSFHNLAQPGVTTIVQSLPHTNVFPYAQNGPSSTFLNGNAADKSSQPIMPNSTMVAVSGSGPSLPPSMASIPNAADSELEGAKRAAQPFTVTSPGTLIHSQTPVQTHLPHQGIVTADGGVGLIIADNSQVAISSAGGGGGAIIGVVGQTPAGIAVVNPEDIKVEATSSIEQMGPGMDESMSSVKTLEPGDTQDPAKLEEAVETMYIGLEGTEEDTDENGGSTVAIDNKIEQAMDLVKRHLMYAVREEVEILKQQIGEMMERIGQLEYENTLLKSEAKPETLSKLLLPRVSQAAAPQQIQMSSGGGGGGSVAAAVGGTAGVVVPSQQQQQQQQQQQSAVLAPQAQKPPTPSGQQTPGAMIPPQQVQTVASGTSTPTQQQQQHLVHQTSTQQPG